MKNKVTTFLSLLPVSLLHAQCESLIDIASSPSQLISVCSVPYKKVEIELNYYDQLQIEHAGFQQSYPNALVRIGLPATSEFFIGPPSYVQQATAPTSGSFATYGGVKHTINYNEQLIFAEVGTIILPSGSYAYGNQRWGGILNGIATYNFNSSFSLSMMLGLSRISEAAIAGGGYFNSVNPDVVIAYGPNDKISVYGEIFGQSKIGVGQGAGFTADVGVELLLSPNFLLNASLGQQLYNYLDGAKHYVTTGIVVMS